MTRSTFGALAVLLTLASAPLAAQVKIVGNARGCFGLGCSPGESAATVLSGVPISYTSAATDFSGTESGGKLAINPTAGTGTFGRLAIGVSNQIISAFSTSFTLSLGFVNPVAPNSVFNALLVGLLVFGDNGGALAIFDPQVVTAPYTDPQTGLSGQISVSPFSVAIPAGGYADITGQIALTKTPSPVPTVTPEPLTVVMVGSGLAGLAAARRRRKPSPAPLA